MHYKSLIVHTAWIKMTEKQPEPGHMYLAASRKTTMVLHYSVNQFAKTDRGREPRWLWPHGGRFWGEVTYWMPLPPPPS